MSFRSKKDFFQEQTLLGAKASREHPELREYALLSKEASYVLSFMRKLKELENIDENDQDAKLKFILDVILEKGKIDFINNNTSEITRLSCIVSDTRKQYSFENWELIADLIKHKIVYVDSGGMKLNDELINKLNPET